MSINIFLCVALAFFFASCSNDNKKIIIYANTNANINEEAKTITQIETEGHVEKTIEFNTSDKVVLKVQSASGETNIEIPENGYYVLNVKAKDTIVGGYQRYSTVQEANRVMTQEQLKHNIDSLQKMIQGQNSNVSNRTFFILPNNAVKISSNTDIIIVGPYHKIASVEQKGNKEPEVYRFYSIKEVREMIEKLMKHT